jgi:hypothetical protein
LRGCAPAVTASGSLAVALALARLVGLAVALALTGVAGDALAKLGQRGLVRGVGLRARDLLRREGVEEVGTGGQFRDDGGVVAIADRVGVALRDLRRERLDRGDVLRQLVVREVGQVLDGSEDGIHAGSPFGGRVDERLAAGLRLQAPHLYEVVGADSSRVAARAASSPVRGARTGGLSVPLNL